MKKIIAVIDGLKYSESTAQYAVYIAKQTGAHLVGVFLDDFTYRSYKIYDLVNEGGFVDEGRMVRLDKKDELAREEAAGKFSNDCREAGVNFTVHHDRNFAIQDLLHESVFADLVIIENKETFTHYEEKIPTRFIRNLLSDVQCPILVVPKHFIAFNKVVLLYDGEPASVYAIRNFSYVFTGFQNLEVEVFSVKDINSSLHVPNNSLIKEFMKRHFPQAAFTVKRGVVITEILNEFKVQDANFLVVLGAYNRGAVSRWLKPSMADVLMNEINKPLFIAHHS